MISKSHFLFFWDISPTSPSYPTMNAGVRHWWWGGEAATIATRLVIYPSARLIMVDRKVHAHNLVSSLDNNWEVETGCDEKIKMIIVFPLELKASFFSFEFQRKVFKWWWTLASHKHGNVSHFNVDPIWRSKHVCRNRKWANSQGLDKSSIFLCANKNELWAGSQCHFSEKCLVHKTCVK